MEVIIIVIRFEKLNAECVLGFIGKGIYSIKQSLETNFEEGNNVECMPVKSINRGASPFVFKNMESSTVYLELSKKITLVKCSWF